MTWRATQLALFALGIAVGIAILDRHLVGVFHDDATYVILAKSLATGEGYRYLNIPGTPVANHFPPGYPALLAIAWRIVPDFPANVVVFKLINVVCLALTAVLVARLVRDRIAADGHWAVASGAITAVSVPLLVLVTMVLSEPLFLVLLLAALVLAERLVSGTVSLHWALVVGIMVAATTLVRAHGIVLLPAIGIALALRGRWREAGVVVAGAALLLVPWQVWSSTNASELPAPLAGNYGSYVSWWVRGYREMGASMIPETVSRTVPEAGAMMAALFSPVRGAIAHAITKLALVVVLLVGAVALRRTMPVTLLFLAGYAAIVVVWPFAPSRFVWGVWPLLVVVVVGSACATTVGLRAGRALPRLAAAAALLWIITGFAAYEWRAIRGAWWSSIPRAGSARIASAVNWTRDNTATSDLLAADDEGAIYLYTGRQAVPVASFTTAHYLRERSPAVEAAEGLAPLIDLYPIRTVLVGSRRTLDAATVLTAPPSPRLAPRESFAGGASFTVIAP